MTAATPTGAELRALRERLGLSRGEMATLIEPHGPRRPFDANDVRVVEASNVSHTTARNAYAAALAAEEARLATETVTAEQVALAIEMARGRVALCGLFGNEWWKSPRVPEHVGNASFEGDDEDDWEPLVVALTRWHAELSKATSAPAEPVPPEGVTVVTRVNPATGVYREVRYPGVKDSMMTWVFSRADVNALEYMAALARHDADQHAAGDRQRKPAAVKAAEEAHEAACVRRREEWDKYRDALKAREDADGDAHATLLALNAARKAAAE